MASGADKIYKCEGASAKMDLIKWERFLYFKKGE